MTIIINTRNNQERAVLVEFLDNHNYDYQIEDNTAPTPTEPQIIILPDVSPIPDNRTGRDMGGPMKIF